MIPVKTFENGAQALAHAQEWARRRWMAAKVKTAPTVIVFKKPSVQTDGYDQHIRDRQTWMSATPKEFIAWRAKIYGSNYALVIGESRARELIEVRHALMAEVRRRYPSLSLATIGRLFGGRDHTTVLSALVKCGMMESKKYSERMKHRSGQVGVHWCHKSEKWRAVIYGSRNPINLGLFKTVDDAVAARQRYFEEKRKPKR